MSNLFTAVADFIREKRPEAKMLRERVSEAGMPPVEISSAEARAMGYEDLNDFRRARLASGEMADDEFTRELRDFMGPYRGGAVAPSRYTQMYGPPINYQGWYMTPGYSTEGTPEDQPLHAQFRDYVRGQGEEPQSDMVYAPSVLAATPYLQAHEFGHRGDSTGRWDPKETRYAIRDTLPDSNTAGSNEKFNLLFDAWRADSTENWVKAVRHWRSITNNPEDYSTRQGNYETYWKAHDELSNLLQLNKDKLLDLEASALEQQALDRKASIEEMLIRRARGLTGVGFRSRREEVQEEVDRLDETYSPENLAKARERDLANLEDQARFRYRQGRANVGYPREPVGYNKPANR